MELFKILKELQKRLINKLLLKRPDFSEKRIFLQGKYLQTLNRKKEYIENFKEIEFSVFSQFGDDGIIDWLLYQLPKVKKNFVEIGVQDYWESNTRFLLKSENWSGILIDASSKDINNIKKQRVYWQHDIKALNHMVNKENINQVLIEKIDKSNRDIGLLSIDIDGVDYWILKELEVVKPSLIICEYNSNFGDIHKITVPYEKNFERTKKHYSNLYFGASIKALISLMEKKGYTFLGTNSAGINAYFVINELSSVFNSKIKKRTIFPSKIRESLDKKGNLTYDDLINRIKSIENLKIYDCEENREKYLKEFKNLYTDGWFE